MRRGRKYYTIKSMEPYKVQIISVMQRKIMHNYLITLEVYIYII